MTFPLMVLAFLSIVGGFIPFSEFVTPDRAGFEAHLNYPLAAIAVSVGVVGIALAWGFYKKENSLSDRFANGFGMFCAKCALSSNPCVVPVAPAF